MRTRIAPTPSGLLHAGNAASFLLTQRLAREQGRELLLRIDDLDQERVRAEYVSDIFRTLELLEIRWDLGPTDPDDLEAHWSQRHRLPQYQALLNELRSVHAVYACTCSRKEVERCSCAQKDLDLDSVDAVWRLRIPVHCPIGIPGLNMRRDVDLAQLMHDPVLRQRNGLPAYQVASLSDDLHYEVDLIVRGEDLLPSSACQLYMAGLLGRSAFANATFIHHRLLLDPAGNKLSKSAGARSSVTGALGPDDRPAIAALADTLYQEVIRS